MNTITAPKRIDWRKTAKETDFDPDDEELDQTPPDVVVQLGFDPATGADVANSKTTLDPKEPNHAHALHAVLRTAKLQAVGNWLVSLVNDRLRELESDLVVMLKRNYFPEQGVDANIARIIPKSTQLITAAFAHIAEDAGERLAKLQGIVNNQQSGAIKKHFGRTVTPQPAAVPLILGNPLVDHFNIVRDATIFRVNGVIRAGIAAGVSMAGLCERIEGDKPSAPVEASAANSRAFINAAEFELPKRPLQTQIRLFDGTENSIEKIIRAALTAIASAADALGGEPDEDEPEDEEPATDREQAVGWTLVAVMDAKTCKYCQSLDGMQWTADYEPVGDAVEYPGEPGYHHGCRCSMISSDLDAAKVPSNIDLDDYLNGMSREDKIAAFGAGPYSSYQRGTMSAAQLIKQSSHKIDLEAFK